MIHEGVLRYCGYCGRLKLSTSGYQAEIERMCDQLQHRIFSLDNETLMFSAVISMGNGLQVCELLDWCDADLDFHLISGWSFVFVLCVSDAP